MDPNTLTLAITFFSAVVGSGLAAAVTNKVQGDDWKESFRGGIAGGIVLGTVACVAWLAIELARLGGV
jgi:hypothetical protein